MKKLSKNNIITIALIIAIYAIVFVLEKVIDSNSMLFIVLKKGAIYALVAVSMNLLNGFTGLFSLGQAGFMLIGAYTYAIFTIPVEYRDAVYQYFDGGIVQFSIPVIPALILAGLAAALFAFLIGLPVLRLKSDYLAIATLGFAEIIRAFFQWDTLGPVTNGSNLLRKFPTFDSTLFPFTVAGICILLIVLLINSSYGRAFKAIRDDEIAAEAMGINLFKHKEMSFVISSFFAGVGGALLAMFQTTVQAMAFKSAMTYEILLIVVIGGIGLRYRLGAGLLPVHCLLRMVAPLPGCRNLHRRVQGASPSRRLPQGGILHHHNGCCAVLPSGHNGRPGAEL